MRGILLNKWLDTLVWVLKFICCQITDINCVCFVTNFCRTHCARMCYKETVDNLTNSAHLAIFSFPNIICTYIIKLWQQKALANLVVHDQTKEVLSTSIFILADLLCKAANPPVFYLRKGFWAVTRQILLPPKIYTIQYVQEFGKFFSPQKDWLLK